MNDTEKDWVVTASEDGLGRMVLCFYEKHETGKHGVIACKELTPHETEQVCEVAFRCCMFQVRNLTP